MTTPSKFLHTSQTTPMWHFFQKMAECDLRAIWWWFTTGQVTRERRRGTPPFGIVWHGVEQITTFSSKLRFTSSCQFCWWQQHLGGLRRCLNWNGKVYLVANIPNRSTQALYCRVMVVKGGPTADIEIGHQLHPYPPSSITATAPNLPTTTFSWLTTAKTYLKTKHCPSLGLNCDDY